jgi:alpha-L-fucosidase 2
MIFGRVSQERLQLNEDTLWAGSPYTPDNPEAIDAIPEVRRLLAAGDYQAATALASEKVMARPLQQMAYGSLGDVLIDFDDAQELTEYERNLDLATAIATTRYRTKSATFLRQAFASAPDDVIAWRTQALKGKLNLAIRYRTPREVKYTQADYHGSAASLAAEKSVDWLAREQEGPTGSDVKISPDGESAILLSGRNRSGSGVAAGLTFALRLDVVSDGHVQVDKQGLRIRDAREVVLLVSAATSYVNYGDVSADPVAKVGRTADAAKRKHFEALKRAHVRDYQALYKGASLELATTQAIDAPTDARIANNEVSVDPAFAALYFKFARYLLISSSRPGCQPANLQGVWNEGTTPPWGSKYTININTEMNYWPARRPCGLE